MDQNRSTINKSFTGTPGKRRQGSVFIVGGAEDRTGSSEVLQHFVDLCGGSSSTLAVCAAATDKPEEAWDAYDTAFAQLGVKQRWPLQLGSVEDAHDPDLIDRVLSADGLFFTGGNQRQLLDVLQGSPLNKALCDAVADTRFCVGGTSAGASALSAWSLSEGSRDILPQKGASSLEPGLSLVRNSVIDQHFSQRQRLARLLSVLAQKPEYVGIGVDEDTALVIRQDTEIEVLGSGSVTLLDGRRMSSNIDTAREDQLLELLNVGLYVLPAGSRYCLDEAPRDDGCAALYKVFAGMLEGSHENH